MRYRNNKSVDGTGAGGVAVAAASAAAAGGGGQKGWSTGGANVAATGGPATQAAVGRYPAVGGATAGTGTAVLGGQQRAGASKVFLVYFSQSISCLDYDVLHFVPHNYNTEI